MGGGEPRKEYLERKKTKEIQEGTQKILSSNICECEHKDISHLLRSKGRGKMPKLKQCKFCPCKKFVSQGEREKNE